MCKIKNGQIIKSEIESNLNSQFGINFNPVNVGFDKINQAQTAAVTGQQNMQISNIDIPYNETAHLDIGQNLDYQTPQAFKNANESNLLFNKVIIK